MKVKVVIEIPKGDDRRRHLGYGVANRDNPGPEDFVDLGELSRFIPVNNGKAPANYGYILGTYNQADEDEVDAIVISARSFKVGDITEALPIALVRREDGDEKVITVEYVAALVEKKWEDFPASLRKTILDFLGYKSAIISVGDQNEALSYLNEVSKSK